MILHSPTPGRWAIAVAAAVGMVCNGTFAQLIVTVTNPLGEPRSNQTIELPARDLSGLGGFDWERLHVKDAAGRELVCQAVDIDFDEFHRPDMLIFQSDFAPNETRKFSVSVGERRQYTLLDFKAYGRFVRERFDDFAWENDCIAHRTYGKALETWKGEPLTSSAIDIWSKRVPRMVINDWYMTDHYHEDTGEGCDDYSAGTSRGCGGTGLWARDRLWVSKNFVESRSLANGPVRVVFELVYEPFEVDGIAVSEVKRVTLDAGSQLDHFESFFKVQGLAKPITAAIGFKKVKGEMLDWDATRGRLAIWEPMEKNLGMQGVGAVLDGPRFIGQSEDKLNHLLLVQPATNNMISYWAGFAWDRAGRIQSQAAWTDYLDRFARESASPVRVSVAVP